MDRNIITKADASRQEIAAVREWIPVLQAVLKNSEANLGVCLRTDASLEAEYWRGSIDTTQYILMLMEAAIERKKNV